MDSSKEQEIEARLARLEGMIAALQRSIDGITSDRPASTAPSRGQTPRRTFDSSLYAAAPPVAPGSRFMPDDLDSTLGKWFSSRTAEWWLSRLGVGFVVLAILILYGYAVDKGWITPPIRVLAGVVVGGIFFSAAIRTERPSQAKVTDLGMRELLYGGALALWYVTAYAASVWYQLISTPSARLLFFALGIISTWIALQERREIFAFLAVATAIATPFILPAPSTSLTELALYLGAVAALGLIIYLMRGWPSIVWMTFIAFWVTIAETIYYGGAVRQVALGSIAISVLLIVMGAAFTRAPSLRRRLLLLGSERYTPAPVTGATWKLMDALDSLSQVLRGGKSAADSLTLWVLTLLSPIVSIGMLSDIWPGVPTQLWGVLFLVLGLAASSVTRTAVVDEETRHVALTAAALWTLFGVLNVAPEPEKLALSALLATVCLLYARKEFIGPRTLAKITIVVALVVVVGEELSMTHSGWLRWRWVVSELVTLGATAVVAQKLIADPAEKLQGAVLAAVGYLASLLVIANILEPIWAPLVTTTYAVLGAVLLILSRRRGGGGERLMRQLGGATMVIVVGRLLIVDLASVETIWRVLLFLVCGALFLYTGYRLQPSRIAEQGK